MLCALWMQKILNRHRLYSHMVPQPEWSQTALKGIIFKPYHFYPPGFCLKIKLDATEEPTNNIN